jgi:hypothetical protein
MKRKMTPHIIAVTAFVAFIVLGLACASTSTPKTPPPPEELMFYLGEQAATLNIPYTIAVHHFDGEQLVPIWRQESIFHTSGLKVRIPPGSHTIGFNFEQKGDVTYRTNGEVNFTAIAGRPYALSAGLVEGTRDEGLFRVIEISDTGEPGLDEQVILFTIEGPITASLVIVFDKDTEDKRSIALSYNPETRVIVPKGDHTIDIELSPFMGKKATIEPIGEPSRHFSISSNPIKYTMTMKTKIHLGGAKDVQYTLTQK